MAASEIGFNRDAFGCPPVREADGTAGAGPHRPSGYRNLEPIVHQPSPLSPGNLRSGLLDPKILTCREVCLRRRQVGRRDARVRLAGMPGCRRRASAWGRCIHPAVHDHLAIMPRAGGRDRSAPASAASPVTSPAPDRARVSRHSRPGRRPTLPRRARTFACILMPGARQGLRSQVTGPRSRVGREWPGHLPCLPVITTSGWVTAKGTCDDS